MINLVEKISLIIWMVYFFLAIYREVKREDNGDLKKITKHIFSYIRIDSLLFFVIFLSYQDFARVDVLPYLYLTIMITNLVYLLYDLVDNYKFKGVSNSEVRYFFLAIIIVAFLIIYLILSKKIIKVFTYTLIIDLFIPCVVTFLKFIKRK